MQDQTVHQRLKSRLREILGSQLALPRELRPLLEVICQSDRETDLDRELLEQVLELTSFELLKSDAKLRSDARQLEARIAERTRDLEKQASERREAQQAQRDIEQRYRALAENSPTGIFHSDADGQTLYVNDSWCHITGLTKEEAMGDGWKKAIHPGDRNAKVSEWADLVEDKKGLRGGEYRLLRPNGDVVWAEGYAVELKDETGSVTGYVGSVHDITEHKLAEEIIRESEERYRSLFEQSSDCIYISSLSGRFIDINQAGLDLLGFETRADALRTEISDLYADPGDRAELIEELREGGKATSRELTLKRTDGSQITVIASITTMRNRDGSIHTMRGVLRDVTQTRLMEGQLRQAQKMEAIGRLAGGVAHDFNNLLTAIIGYSDLLTMSLPEGSPAQENAAEVKSIARRGASLTKQLLAFSRRQLVAPANIQLNKVVAEMRSLLERLIGEDVRLLTDLDDSIGPVLADPTQIEQIVVNLAINGRDAMPGGGTLAIRTEPYDSRIAPEPRFGTLRSGRYVRLVVSDEGSGIDPEIQDRIFEPFFTTKPEGQGTGLGLATVYGAVQQAGGAIFVSSALGAGSTFEVLLPQVEGEPDKPRAKPPSSDRTEGTETILIAEDEPTVREFLARLLTSQGYSVLTACDGVEALQLARTHTDKIDLLLSDVVMPKMNGIELARRLRVEMKTIKILLVTGYSEDQEALRQAGDAYLQKPFAPQVLTRCLRDLLDHDAPIN